MLAGINYFAVIVCTLFSVALGFFWYTPLGFGKAWMKATGIKDEDVDQKDAMKAHLVSLIGSFITVLVMAVLMNLMAITGWRYGMYLGMALGIGVLGAAMIPNNMYEQRPFSLSIINVSYRVVYLMITGIVLGVWQ